MAAKRRVIAIKKGLEIVPVSRMDGQRGDDGYAGMPPRSNVDASPEARKVYNQSAIVKVAEELAVSPSAAENALEKLPPAAIPHR